MTARERNQIARLTALVAEQERRRTRGGIPPAADRTWANLAYTTPPATAGDPSAPPLHRPTRALSPALEHAAADD